MTARYNPEVVEERGVCISGCGTSELYTFATNVLIVIHDESPLVYRGPDVSEHSHFGTRTIRDCTTALFQVTMCRQFARKVGTSANSALIRYNLLRLKLSSSTHDRE